MAVHKRMSLGTWIGENLVMLITYLLFLCNHHYYLWFLYHLHRVFQILKNIDHCAAWSNRLLYNGRKQNGKSYDVNLL